MKNLGRLGLVVGVLTLAGTAGCEKPDPAKEHRIKATNHFKKGEIKQAIAEYDLSLQADPNQEKTWKEKAFAHQKLAEHENAAEALLKYVEFVKDPKEQTELYTVIATEFRSAGMPDEAEKALMKVMETKTTPEEKAELYRVIADQYRLTGNLDQAEARFNEALKLNPKDEASLGWLAAIASKRGGTENPNAPAVPEHLEKALQYLDQVAALNPDYPFTYINKRIVVAKYQMHETKQAEVAMLEAKTAKGKKAVAEAQARAVEHQKRADEYKAQFDELTVKFTEAQKKAKEKKEAEAKAAAAAQPAAPAK